MDEVKQEISTFENFSNELFYEVFDYLDGIDLYNAFSNLNNYFQQLLKSPFVLFKIKHFYSKPIDGFKNTWDQINRYHRQQIFSLDLWMSPDTDEFYFSSYSIDSSLNHLQSLAIHELETDILIPVLKKLNLLPCLYALTIDMGYIIIDLTEIYRFVLSLPVLKYYKFTTFDDENLIISLPMATDKFSSIEYLTTNHICTFNDLSLITSYTPKLQYLKFRHDINGNNTMNRNLPAMILTNLTTLSIYDYDATFDTFQGFISKLYANIKILRFITQSQDMNYFNSYQWEKFIPEQLPHLEEFHFDYREYTYDDDVFPTYTGLSNPFTSSFWLEKQWLFRMTIENDSIIYSVRSYKKRWYEDIDDSSLDLSKSTLLTIDDIRSTESLLNCLKRCLAISQIYHLEISVPQIDIHLLIQIINHLPELHSLKVHSVSYAKLQQLNNDQLALIYSASNRTKIQKFSIQLMAVVHELSMITILFPYITFFKVDYICVIDTESCLEGVLMRINNRSTNHLRLLCFTIPTIDDETYQEFHQMINHQRLSMNYTIKRFVDKIYLEWKSF